MSAALLKFTDNWNVRDSEGNAAKMTRYDSQDNWGKDFNRDCTFKSKKSQNIYTDIEQKSETEWGHKDQLKSPVPISKFKLEDAVIHEKNQNDLENEFRPLPSPIRSSLRSPNKDLSGRHKEGYHVTFSEKNFSDVSSQKEMVGNPLDKSSDMSYNRITLLDNKDKLATFVSQDCRQQSLNQSSILSRPAKSENMKNERTKLLVTDNTSWCTDDPSSFYREEGKSNRERLLKASTDLFVSTHLNDSSSSLNYLSALRKGLTDAPRTYTLPSKPTLGQTYQSFTKMEKLPVPDFRDQRKAWNLDKDVSLPFGKMDEQPNGIKRSSSLNSLLPQPKLDNSYTDRYSDNLLSGNQSQEKNSPLECPDLLEQLIDLVDRYWNGSRSLLQNQRFLVPARELLSSHISPNGIRKVDAKSNHRKEGENENEFLKQKLNHVIKENQILQSKILKLETKATGSGERGAMSTQGDLWQKYEKLSLQVESLQQQLKQSHKLQETVNLLHDSQRSLACTNEYLLQQLNKIAPSQVSKTPYCSEYPRIIEDKYLSSESKDLTSLSSVQCRNSDRLSLCPL